MKRGFLWLLFVGALVVIAGVLLQAFSIAAYARGAGEGALDMHSAVSLIVHVGELAIVIGAIVGWRATGEPSDWRSRSSRISVSTR